jgi:N-acetylmuramoyl-L-alanine amidase
MLNVTKKLIKYNYSPGNDIKYIVVHDTGNKRKGADAYANYRYFNSKDRKASAHYFVDDKEILQLVEDHNASWHCGDGKGKYGITNHNSIGIEVCVNEDGNYEKAVENAVDLVKYLMDKYNIPLERVVRHYDASRKICPKGREVKYLKKVRKIAAKNLGFHDIEHNKSKLKVCAYCRVGTGSSKQAESFETQLCGKQSSSYN